MWCVVYCGVGYRHMTIENVRIFYILFGHILDFFTEAVACSLLVDTRYSSTHVMCMWRFLTLL